MIANIQRTVITTLSGIAGGLGKALSFTPLHITLAKTLEVFFFACVSAAAGYLVKYIFDSLLRYYKSKNHPKP